MYHGAATSERETTGDRERDGEPQERGRPADGEAAAKIAGEDDADQALREDREAKADARE